VVKLKYAEDVSVKISSVVRDELISSLKALELSTYESKVFLTLLLHPQLTASEICKETGIPDSKIYYALDGLLKKGMIILQRGRPNMYKALHPKEAITNLKQKLQKEFAEKMERTNELIVKLSPLYEKAEGSKEIEIAYVIRGQRSVINKMNELIRSSEREVIAFIPDFSILSRIEEALLEAMNRGIKVNLALTSNMRKTKTLKGLRNIKLLRCPCCMLVSDMLTLLTIHNWKAENCYAILTHDPNLLTISKEYYKNPKCCAEIRK
jgi:sugar-specific transcriptional regulator TrmB